MAKEVIEKARDELSLISQSLVDEATSIVDEYWMVWRLKNKQLKEIELQRGSAEGYLRGNVAPRIVVRTGKTYIEWVRYEPGRYGAKSKSWGERIAPRKGPVYRMIQFESKTQEWEFEMIKDAEEKLRPLRYALEHIHNSRAYLSRLVHRL